MIDSRIQYLVNLGHNFNPKTPIGKLTDSDLSLLTMSDVAVKNMVASYQEMMSLLPDSDWGPITDQSIQTERCGHPDYQEAGGGTFDNPCFSDGIRFSYNDRSRPSNFSADNAEQMIESVITANAEMGARLIQVSTSSFAHIRVSWEVLRGSTIGLAQLTNGPCGGRSLFCKINPNYSRSGLTQMKALLCHEIAHNYGHQHQPTGIMSPTIVQLSSWRGWEKRDPAYQVWKRYAYNGFNPLTPTNPEPPPTPSGVKLSVQGDMVTAWVGDEQQGKFLAIIENGELRELRPWASV